MNMDRIDYLHMLEQAKDAAAALTGMLNIFKEAGLSQTAAEAMLLKTLGVDVTVTLMEYQIELDEQEEDEE